MGNLPGQEQTYQVAKKIDETMTQQEKDLNEIDKAMKDLEVETKNLKSAIGEASRHSKAQCSRVS